MTESVWIVPMDNGWLCHDGHSWCWSHFARLIAYFPSEAAAKEGLALFAAQTESDVSGTPRRHTVGRGASTTEALLCRLALSRFVQGAEDAPATLVAMADALGVGCDWMARERRVGGNVDAVHMCKKAPFARALYGVFPGRGGL